MERTYIIPLRKAMQKAPRWKHTSKAVKEVRKFLQRHMKNEIVKLGRHLNMELHKNGMKNTPHKIEVRAWTEKVKIDDKEVEIVKADWINAPKEEVKVEEKSKQVKGTVAKEDVKKEDKLEKTAEMKNEVLQHEKVEHGGKHTTDSKVPTTQSGKEESAISKQNFRKAQTAVHEKKK